MIHEVKYIFARTRTFLFIRRKIFRSQVVVLSEVVQWRGRYVVDMAAPMQFNHFVKMCVKCGESAIKLKYIYFEIYLLGKEILQFMRQSIRNANINYAKLHNVFKLKLNLFLRLIF